MRGDSAHTAEIDQDAWSEIEAAITAIRARISGKKAEDDLIGTLDTLDWRLAAVQEHQHQLGALRTQIRDLLDLHWDARDEAIVATIQRLKARP